MKQLRIVQFAPLYEPIPPRKYGGIELVVYNLVAYLARRGHKVTAVTAGTNPRLLPSGVKVVNIFSRSVREIMVQHALPPNLGREFELMGIGEGLRALKGERYDIIHSHLGWHLFPYKSFLKGTMVSTLHGPLDKEHTPTQYFYRRYRKEQYISVSNSQRRPVKLNYAGTVYNGIEVEKFTFNAKQGEYLAWLGRISPDKGPVQAIQAAKKAGEKLVIAAKVDLYDVAFWKREVEPLIDGKQIVYIGEVDHKGKDTLLQNAKALLALIQWDEPFGLFFVEALACGTPVIATPRGSVPEILEEGQTGFFARNVDEAVRAIKKISTIDRAYCRAYVERRFSCEAMGRAYEEIYYKILKNGIRTS